MFQFYFFLIFIILGVTIRFISITLDRRRIRAFLQRRGATNIHIQTRFRGSTYRKSSRHQIAIYNVTYLSATGQTCKTSCQRLDGGPVDWADGMSDIYDLVPAKNSQSSKGVRSANKSVHNFYTLLGRKPRTQIARQKRQR